VVAGVEQMVAMAYLVVLAVVGQDYFWVIREALVTLHQHHHLKEMLVEMVAMVLGLMLLLAAAVVLAQ